MTPESSDSDRTEAPVSNEELYCQLREVKLNQHLTMSMALVAAAIVLVAMDATVFALVSLLGGVLFLAMAIGLRSRNRFTGLVEFFDGYDEFEETIDESRERLTDAARTDGGGGGDEQ